MRLTRALSSVVLLAALAFAAPRAHGQIATPSPSVEARHHGHHDFSDVDRSVTAFEAPDRAAWQKPDEVVASLHLAPGQTVADIGASTGYFARRLATAVGPTGTVWALDVAPSLVDYMATRARREKQPNLRPRVVPPDDPQLAEGSVDLVLIVNTLHHIESRPQYYAKIARALKSGGRIAIVDFLPTSPIGPKAQERLPRALVEKELRDAGFAIADEPTFLPYQYFVVARLER